MICGMIIALLVVLSASLMYFLEHDAQPEKFCDIPSSMWWAVTTLTTVGYGDVYPMTPLGKIFGALIQISGIAFFALPTAVLGAGLIDDFRRNRRPCVCPNCGADINPSRD